MSKKQNVKSKNVNVDEQTGEIYENQNGSFLEDKHENLGRDKYATKSGKLKQTQIRFHNCEKDGKFTGIFIGLGKKVKGWATYLFFDTILEEFVMIPAYKVLEEINDNCEPGEWLVSIEHKGKGKNKAGQPVNYFTIKTDQLVIPFTDFDLDELREM